MLCSLSCHGILGLRGEDDTDQSPCPPAVDTWQEGMAALGCLTHLRCCDCRFSVNEPALTDAAGVPAGRQMCSVCPRAQCSRVRLRFWLFAVTVLLPSPCLQNAAMLQGKQS